jgi:hypothetical protein
MAVISKQSVVNIYDTHVRAVRTARVQVDSASNPGSSRIDTTKLGPGSFPNVPTSAFGTKITASTIGSVFRDYARYTTTIRRVRHGYNFNSFVRPANASSANFGTTDDTTQRADLIDSTYKDDNLVANTAYTGEPVAGNTVTQTTLISFAQALENAADDSEGLSVVDLRVCHSSCHNSCHGSRGRR